jgi:ribosomal protein L29
LDIKFKHFTALELILKSLDIKDIRVLDIPALNSKIYESRVELFNLKMKKNTTGMTKPHLVSVLKKNIARLQMALSEKIKDIQ